MSNIIVCTSKVWDKNLISDLSRCQKDYTFYLVTETSQLTPSFVEPLDPEFIFFPHWSSILVSEIYLNYECIMFHMTDLPFGRGGSPLQNLISNGFRTTKICAFKCDGGIDTGPVYFKKDLDLSGSAEEIFIRATTQIKHMILDFLMTRPQPQLQVGAVTEFKRRKPEQSEIDFSKVKDLEALYDHVRMLDAEGYPLAFFNLKGFKFTFSKANFLKDKGELSLHLTINKSGKYD